MVKGRINPTSFLIHGILIVGAIVMIGPLIWMVLTSFKSAANAEAFFDTPRDFVQVMRGICPDPFLLDNYRAVFTERPMLSYYLNSAAYTGLKMLPGLLFCSLGGFIFAKLRFPGRQMLFAATIMLRIKWQAFRLYVGKRLPMFDKPAPDHPATTPLSRPSVWHRLRRDLVRRSRRATSSPASPVTSERHLP